MGGSCCCSAGRGPAIPGQVMAHAVSFGFGNSRRALRNAHLGVDAVSTCAVEHKVDVCLATSMPLQELALLAQLEQLMRLHLFTAAPPFAKGAIVAEDVVQCCAWVETILADRELEANVRKVVEGKLVAVDDPVVIQVSALKLFVHVVPNALLPLYQSTHSVKTARSGATVLPFNCPQAAAFADGKGHGGRRAQATGATF